MPLLALMYLGWRVAGLPFTPFDLFGLVTRLLPGPVITAAVEVMVGTLQTLRLGSTAVLAKSIEAVMALGLMLVLLAALGALYGAAGHRLPGPPPPQAER